MKVVFDDIVYENIPGCKSVLPSDCMTAHYDNFFSHNLGLIQFLFLIIIILSIIISIKKYKKNKSEKKFNKVKYSIIYIVWNTFLIVLFASIIIGIWLIDSVGIA